MISNSQLLCQATCFLLLPSPWPLGDASDTSFFFACSCAFSCRFLINHILCNCHNGSSTSQRSGVVSYSAVSVFECWESELGCPRPRNFQAEPRGFQETPRCYIRRTLISFPVCGTYFCQACMSLFFPCTTTSLVVTDVLEIVGELSRQVENFPQRGVILQMLLAMIRKRQATRTEPFYGFSGTVLSGHVRDKTVHCGLVSVCT